jgi:hypothetical protein
VRLRPGILVVGLLGGCACPAIVSVTPADGTDPVVRDAVIRVALDGKPGDVTFSVTGPDGEIPGTVSYGAVEAVFTPTGLLPEGAEIDYAVTVCDASAYGTFTVGAIEHASPPEELDGNTYALDLAGATWVTPASGGALLEQFFDGAVLVGIEAVNDVQLDAIGASGQATTSGGWQQDPCFATIDFQPVDFTTNPYFHILAETVEFTVAPSTVTVHDVEISGGLTADEVVDGRFAGEIDFREVDLVQNGCSMVSMLGLSCTDCTSDGEPFCLFIEAEDVEGEAIPGLSVVPNENPEECD